MPNGRARAQSVLCAKIKFFDFEIATYDFMANNFQRTVPKLLLCHCEVVETIHAAEQKQRAEKFKIEGVKEIL